jgi:hypothetical protein
MGFVWNGPPHNFWREQLLLTRTANISSIYFILPFFFLVLRALIRLEKLKNLIEKNKSRNSSYQIQIYSLLGAAHKLKEDSDIAAEYFLKVRIEYLIFF